MVEPMTKGLSKYWTPKQEELWARRLKNCRTFAQQHLTMSLRDLLKFDKRTKEGKRAIAQGRLRLTVATDRDLEELVELEMQMLGGDKSRSAADQLEDYKGLRTKLKERGIERSELGCR